MSILEEIFTHKQQEVAISRQRLPIEQLTSQASQITGQVEFKAAIQRTGNQTPRLIAEIKFKSPSKGVLNENLDPIGIAKIYAENGAAAISVLTDKKYFGGSLEILKNVHAQGFGLPLLRKDFIFDRYQLLEARVAGASAVLLIAAMLDTRQLADLVSECQNLSLTPLVEVHDEIELANALEANAQVIGINNRNLHDFSVDLETSFRLANLCPPEVVIVAESGINSIDDIQSLEEARIDAVLVGEALVAAPDIASKVRSLAGVKTV